MQRCPHCASEIRIRELRHPGLFASFRICPGCGRRITVDAETKCRQAVFMAFTVVSLAFTLLLYFQSGAWLFPTLASYLLLGVLLYRGNRKLYLVPYDAPGTAADDG